MHRQARKISEETSCNHLKVCQQNRRTWDLGATRIYRLFGMDESGESSHTQQIVDAGINTIKMENPTGLSNYFYEDK